MFREKVKESRDAGMEHLGAETWKFQRIKERRVQVEKNIKFRWNLVEKPSKKSMLRKSAFQQS